jgi:uncharacterized protein YgiM (DUF1202 family)
MKKLLMFKIMAIIVICPFFNSFGQESYVVITNSLNVRDEPSLNAKVLGKLTEGDVVAFINNEYESWYYVSYYGVEGYVASKYLVKVEESEKYKDWEKAYIQTGDEPDCENITPKHDRELDNELHVIVGNTADVVVKLMEFYGNCIRIAYIKSGDSYKIKNIPEGRYYLKIAYGKDLYKNTKDNQCIVKFLRNPSYEKGEEVLDFNKVQKPNTVEGDYEYENWVVPSFTLSLNIEYSKGSLRGDTFHSKDITETDFNR